MRFDFSKTINKIADRSAQQACTISVHFALVSKQMHVRPWKVCAETE